MKTLTRIFAPLAVLGALASCQMYKIDTQMTPEKAAASIRMECSAVDVYTLASQDPDAITFNVSANTPWTLTLSSGADWLDVTPASSAASSLITDVVVVVKSNTSLEDRSATLTLRGENIAKTKVITIKQGRAGRLYVTPPSKDFSAAGGPLNFTIQTNQDWEVRCDQSWISFNREKGTPDPEGRTLTIVAVAEPSDVLERSATITVKAGDDEESFNISQTGSFSLTALSDPFESAGGDQTFSLKTDLPWEIVADQTWLTFDQTSGIGDATITATAAANEGALRTVNVTVSAGGVDKSFVVSQKGFTFEIVAPASTELPRLGGEMVLAVNTALAWEPSTDVPGWSVEKIDASSFKVKADFNNIFIPKTGVVKITAAGVVDELELTQDINFSFSGVEVLEDGSVKIESKNKARVTLLDPARYASFVLELGDVVADDKAELVLSTHDANGSEMQCQIRLGAGKNRLRTNGGATGYNTADINMTVAELNALTTYRMDFVPNAENPANIDVAFTYNGTPRASITAPSPFVGNEATATYFFGTEDASAGSTAVFIVKSCTPTFIAE